MCCVLVRTRPSSLVSPTSYLLPRTSYLVPRTSYLVLRTSSLVSRTSYLVSRTSYLKTPPNPPNSIPKARPLESYHPELFAM